ncbi:hypothetical protein GGQ84_001029 [Desulfitispora alkaliphila]|uniref:YczE/YyaS/YitT family protein n=1 Tax=Desulfitispora alkaliphila TaxID=622674 RepID=UPI003D21076C
MNGLKGSLEWGMRISLFMLALMFMSLGLDILIKASLGVAPWDVLHTGLELHLPFTLGQVMIGAGFFLLMLSWILGVRPTVASFMNMFFIGFFYDLLVGTQIVPHSQGIWMQVVYLILGINIVAFSTALYISTNMGTGPRDSLMIAINKLTSLRVGMVRTVIEVAAVITGFLLGGIVGLGTLAFSLTIGFTMEMYMNLIERVKEMAKAPQPEVEQMPIRR